MSDPVLGTSTIFMLLLAGTNGLLYIMFTIMIRLTSSEGEVVDGGDVEMVGKDEKQAVVAAKPTVVTKKLSKPFVGTVSCFTELTSEFTRVSVIMAMTYICERHWFFEHSGKEYSREWFLFILALFFGYAIYTIKPIRDLSLLGREQTEEWKGWMQFIFLLYHYFHAEEVYNSVRVMITCYVWMTGFGNFSFFYIKRDYSWLRLVQMLWRLNFTVVLLMWTHGNTWILYYICPMHTFYFLVVFVTMYVYQNVNHSKWGIRVKILLLGLLIYLVWDINKGLFDFLFAWLGTDKVIGANSGSVWEYYFRTSLDHWSSYFGMIFACNFPLAEQFFIRGKGAPLYITAVLLGVLTIYWLVFYYSKQKFDYNQTHSYMALIPLTAYIYFRNMSPWIRGFVSMSLHDLGKTTLETYLLQHHIWLTSNAKTLLTIVPGWPKVNFFIATIIFFLSSKELYRLTMTLRGMVLPDDPKIAWNNMLGGTIFLAVYYIAATVLVVLELGDWHGILTLTLIMATLTVTIIRLLRVQATEHSAFSSVSSRIIALLSVAAIALIATRIMGASVRPSFSAGDALTTANGAVSMSQSTKLALSSIGQAGLASNVPHECIDGLNRGKWVGEGEDRVWAWGDVPAHCGLQTFDTAAAKALYTGKKVIFAGDSIVRQTYHEFIRLLEPSFSPPRAESARHTDQAHMVKSSGTHIAFIWAPYASDLQSVVKKVNKRDDVQGMWHCDTLVIGAGLWDALWHGDEARPENTEKYQEQVQSLAMLLAWSNTGLTSRDAAFANEEEGVLLTASSRDKSEMGQIAAAAAAAVKVRLAHFFGDGRNHLFSPTPEPSVPVTVWMQPTTILDDKLNTDRKKHQMTEAVVDKYRQASDELWGGGANAILYPGRAVTPGRERAAASSDGVHYGAKEYSAMAQMVVNTFALHNPQLLPRGLAGGSPDAGKAKSNAKPYAPKRTGSMSRPGYGAAVLFVSMIMLLTMDNFFGLGYLSLALFGRHYDWAAAYSSLHKSLGISMGGGAGEEQEQEQGLLQEDKA